MTLLEDAFKALEYARGEYKEYLKTRDPVKLRNICEKGWLAVALATDYLITCAGVEKPHRRIERNELLEELEERVEEVKKLGMSDRIWARSQRLHSEGFYEGWISDKSLERELKRVEDYLNDVKNLAEIVSLKKEELKPALTEVKKRFER
ncbi:hypothetical protein CW703_07180 [Candidatus Bathyarchaeota archaeon]|nr:MAG: hypothetical protein CW703_07180 [Candidatus Bathyarchaeota archaeon]